MEWMLWLGVRGEAEGQPSTVSDWAGNRLVEKQVGRQASLSTSCVVAGSWGGWCGLRALRVQRGCNCGGAAIPQEWAECQAQTSSECEREGRARRPGPASGLPGILGDWRRPEGGSVSSLSLSPVSGPVPRTLQMLTDTCLRKPRGAGLLGKPLPLLEPQFPGP